MNPELQKLLAQEIRTELRCIMDDPLLKLTAGKNYKVRDIHIWAHPRKSTKMKFFVLKNDEGQEISIKIKEASRHFEDTYHELLQKLKNIKEGGL
jgi:hypothetical protein